MEYIGRPYAKTYGHAYQGKVYRPRCRVSFHTNEALFSFEGGYPDPTSELISVKTQKSLSQPTGTATITLVPRLVNGQDWFGRINAMDFFTIDMKGDLSNSWTTVMAGFVDQVRENFVAGDGNSPQRAITITASDFGKILTRSNLDFYTSYDYTNKYQVVIKSNKEANIYMLPNNSSPVVGVIPAGTEHEVINQIGSYYYIEAKQFGYGYIYTGDVSKSNNAEPIDKATQVLMDTLQGLSASYPAGDLQITGFWTDVLGALNSNSSGTAVEIDPFSIMAKIFTQWIYKVMNVSSIVYGSKGAIQADLPSLFRFILIQAKKYADISWKASVPDATSGTIWNVLQSLAMLPFGEMWTDIREDYTEKTAKNKQYSTSTYDTQLKSKVPGGLYFNNAQPVFVWRPIPYDTDDWQSLTLHKVNNKLIREYDLGKSDLEEVNCYWTSMITTNIYDSNITNAMLKALVDAVNAAKYGLQSLRINLNAYASDLNSTVTLNQKLYEWYKDNPQYLSGSMTIKGDPTIRIGQRLLYEDTGYSFYIEGVTQTYTYNQEYTTQLDVSRGLIRND